MKGTDVSNGQPHVLGGEKTSLGNQQWVWKPDFQPITKLKGTNAADAFTFDVFEHFTKKAVDKIIGFDSSQRDTIAVSPNAFPALENVSEINFVSTNGKKELKLLSKEDYNYVYFEKKGRLYFDGNGTDKGWGNSSEGGLFAVLAGKPELNVRDFTLLD